MTSAPSAGQVVRESRSRVARRGSRESVRGSRTRPVVEVGALLLIAVLLVAGPIMGRQGAVHFETSSVLTSRGDTLWTIARAHPVPGLTTAESVEVIATLNDLETANVQAGTSVRVPASDSENIFALR
jgi:hypothetical protein